MSARNDSKHRARANNQHTREEEKRKNRERTELHCKHSVEQIREEAFMIIQLTAHTPLNRDKLLSKRTLSSWLGVITTELHMDLRQAAIFSATWGAPSSSTAMMARYTNSWWKWGTSNSWTNTTAITNTNTCQRKAPQKSKQRVKSTNSKYCLLGVHKYPYVISAGLSRGMKLEWPSRSL